MIRLIRVELWKLLCKKHLWIILLALTVFWCYFIGYTQWKAIRTCPIRQDTKKYLADISGPLTQEKFENILFDYQLIQEGSLYTIDVTEIPLGDTGHFTINPFADWILMSSVKAHAEYIVNESKNRKIIIEQAQRNIERLHRENGSLFNIRENEKIVEMYQNAEELVLTQADNGWKFYFNENNHTILLLIFLLVLLTPVFAGEYESGAFSIVFSSKSGRDKTALAKLFSACIISIITASYFETVNYLCFSISYYMVNFSLPVRNIEAFSTSPFNFSIGQFVLIKYAFFTLYSVACGLLICFLSKFFSKSVPTLISGAVVLGSSYGISYYFTAPLYIVGEIPLELRNTGEAMQKWVFSFLVHPNVYFNQFAVINFANYPIFTYWIIIVTTVITCLFFGSLTFGLYTKNFTLRMLR
ncbi:MAG: hypothetical protein FWD44_05785 [Oscillospiraceae bacterium]|nr:hypothetical protein [Oscillospiraceae bacterium]